MILQAGDASGTGLFDTANRTYDSKRLGSIDSALEDKFPQLIGPNEVNLAYLVETAAAQPVVRFVNLDKPVFDS